MAAKSRKANEEIQAWIDARKRHHLSHAQVQMARELGMNPRKLGKLDNHNQQPWKMSLRQYIGHLYHKRLGKHCPDTAIAMEDGWRFDQEKQKNRRRDV